MNLNGKRIIVTGAASGIGQRSARIMKQRGAEIIGFDCNQPTEFVDEYIPVDLSDRASIVRAAAQLSGRVDGLCNIAGLPPTAPVEKVLAVNFVGLRCFTEAVVDKLNDGASIVNLASLAGVAWPEHVADINKFIVAVNFDNISALCDELNIDAGRSYFFSKELLIVWTFQNWSTWRNRSIRINAVSPGPVDTPILGDFLKTLGERAEEDMQVMGRAGNPNEIAEVVAFLCGDESGWINGANIAVDGGMNAHVINQICAGADSSAVET